MSKNWKLIAEGNGVPVSAADLEKFAPALTALDEAFRPLTAGLPLEVEPAVTLSEDSVAPR